jgi:hypothetical protein
MNEFKRELVILWRLSTCPHITHVVGFIEISRILLILPFTESLADFLRRSAAGVGVDMVKDIFDGVAGGLNAMHSNGFIHCAIQVSLRLLRRL